MDGFPRERWENLEMAETNGKWLLFIGCHKETLLSREADVKECDSLETCKKAVAEAEKFWVTIGYRVWFARAEGPNGEKVKLHEGAFV